MKKWSEMTARERDALVAEKVMGYTWAPRFNCFADSLGEPLARSFNPSDSIEDAWRVVEKMALNSLSLVLFTPGSSNVCDGCFAVSRYRAYFQTTLTECDEGGDLITGWGGGEEADADTAPLTICLAALRAVGVEIE